MVNTATRRTCWATVHVTDAGAGKLNAADAVNVAATLEPAAISFGPIDRAADQSHPDHDQREQRDRDVFVAVRQLTIDSNAQVTLSQTVVNLPAGQSQSITVSLTGSRPASGRTKASSTSRARGPELHLPYFYVVGIGVPYDIFPMQNGSFTGIPNDFGWRLALRVVDPYGVPVANTPVSFRVVSGGGKFNAAGGDKTTDVLGNAGVFVDLGPQQGDQIFTGTAGRSHPGIRRAMRAACPPSRAAAW